MSNLDERAAKLLGITGKYERTDEPWGPTIYRDHAAMMEAEVERRELRHKYVAELWKIVFVGEEVDYIDISGFDMQIFSLSNDDWDIEIMWKFITATPAQRTEAAVAVLEAQDE